MFTDNERGSMTRADHRLHGNTTTRQSPPPFQRGPSNLCSELWRPSFLTDISCSCQSSLRVSCWKQSGELALLSQQALCRPQFRNNLLKSHQNCKRHFHTLSTLEKTSLGRDSLSDLPKQPHSVRRIPDILSEWQCNTVWISCRGTDY